MCGRYYIDDEALDEAEEILQSVNKSENFAGGRDVHPTDKAPVFFLEEGHIVRRDEIWGYPRYGGSGVIFNTRSETADVKPLFRNGFENGRLLIPASLFYEWDSHHEKYIFDAKKRGQRVLFLAGISDRFRDSGFRYSILTTAANASVMRIHPRMPLVLDKEEAFEWLRDTEKARRLLRKIPQSLNARPASGQMSLFDLQDG